MPPAEVNSGPLARYDDSPAFERIILPYVENLRLIGVDASFELIDSAEFQERRERFDYDITTTRFVLPLSPSVELRNLFASDSADEPGSFNVSGVSDPVVDELIERIIAAPDRATTLLRMVKGKPFEDAVSEIEP